MSRYQIRLRQQCAITASEGEFANSYSGSWSWPFGQNCHSFQEEMVRKLGTANSTQEGNKISVEYYHGFTGYHLPPRLTDPMTKEEAESSDGSYCIAHRDTAGRILEVTSLFCGELFFRQEYTYDDAGVLTEVRSRKSDGRIFRKKYNAQGKLLMIREESPAETAEGQQ